ncbi:hypothetical protein MOE20_06530 [Bacillus atrophaeus]|uniref:hypothetical protein n=1 Tax=Bacillus atrophaeus TaxID=1452 RepID=UPI002281FFBC|nr:hypothetical protein [Bacillus atrophaeus]MCY8915671.1 hypothetical protein [Bacillus atrophaeus]MCY8924288.1 hypothetical protein [Bacillus atrophaeus]
MASKPKDKEIRLTLLKLDRHFTLDNIIENLKLDYRKPIGYLTERQNLSSPEKILNNKWYPANNAQAFTKKTFNVGDSNIEYVLASGYYEKSASEEQAIVNGYVLPRERRVFNRTCEAIFFNLNGQVYCVIEVSQSEERNVKSILFGQGRGINKKEEWGKVEHKDITQFSFDSNIFYWLISKKGSQFNYENSDFKFSLTDITAISNQTDRLEYDSTNSGSNILGSSPALTALGSNHSVYEAGLSFKTPNMTLLLRLSETSTCYVNVDKSFVTLQSGDNVNVKQDLTNVVLSIYTVILLTLKGAYNSASDKSEKQVTQRRNWALLVIRTLCEENEIPLNEIKKLLDDES